MTRYTKRNGLSRRTLLKSGVAAAAGTLAAPMVWAQSNIVLRQAGTGVSAFNESQTRRLTILASRWK